MLALQKTIKTDKLQKTLVNKKKEALYIMYKRENITTVIKEG